jgi:hypothetical protein
MLRHHGILGLILLVSLAGCASQKTGPSQAPARPSATTSETATTGTAQPAEPARPSAEEQSAVEGQEAEAGNGYTPCEQEMEKECPSGYKDGCEGGLTSYHVCVREGAKPGPKCGEEVVEQCFPGEKDACLTEPTVAPHHICFKP